MYIRPQLRVAIESFSSEVSSLRQLAPIPRESGEAQIGRPRLSSAEHRALAAHLEVEFGESKAI